MRSAIAEWLLVATVTALLAPALRAEGAAPEGGSADFKRGYETGYKAGYEKGYRDAADLEPDAVDQKLKDGPLSAVDDDVTIFDKRSQAPVGLFGGLLLRSGSALGAATTMPGGGVGLVVDHRYMIGGSFVEVADAKKDAIKFTIAYRGLEVGYVLKPEAFLHYRLGSLIGTGQILYETLPEPRGSRTGDSFFVLEPEALVEISLGPWIRLGAGVTYRLVDGLALGSVVSSDLSGVTLGMSLRGGFF